MKIEVTQEDMDMADLVHDEFICPVVCALRRTLGIDDVHIPWQQAKYGNGTIDLPPIAFYARDAYFHRAVEGHSMNGFFRPFSFEIDID